MINNLKKLVCGKRVLILGFGREGRSTYNLLKSIGGYSILDISDKTNIDGFRLANNPSNLGNATETILHTGENYLECIKYYDIVFKSPGIPLFSNVDIGDAIITSEIEQFIKVYSSRIIGITGTKGKSTTSSLIYSILKNAGFDTIFAGNIGIPVFDIINDINENTIIVIELSCHQLEHCKYSPHRAILLNIYEEHLDHYESFEDYANTKKQIFLNQSENDFLYISKGLKLSNSVIKSKIRCVNVDDLPFNSFDEIPGCKLIGEHNLLNAAFAYDVAKDYKIQDNVIIDSYKKFIPLKHRLEFIGNVGGIDYYDDSIGTAAEASIFAIKTIKNIDTILIGGMDRKINYDSLIYVLKQGYVRNIILMYESGKRIYDTFNQKHTDKYSIYYTEDLEKAVELAKKITRIGMACVMSPASASYGYFKNFEERGDKFNEYVKRGAL